MSAMMACSSALCSAETEDWATAAEAARERARTELAETIVQGEKTKMCWVFGKRYKKKKRTTTQR